MHRRIGRSDLFDFSPFFVQIVFGRIVANPLIALDLQDLAKYFTGR